MSDSCQDAPESRGMTHSKSTLSIGQTVVPTGTTGNMTQAAFEAAVHRILETYLEAGDSASVAAAVESLKNLDAAVYHDLFVVKAITSVLSEFEATQSKIAQLITLAYDTKLLTQPQVTRGFEKLLEIAGTSDVENVEDKLFSFFAAASDDKVVGPLFMLRLPELFIRSLTPAITEHEPDLLKNAEKLRMYKQECSKFMEEFFNIGHAECVVDFLRETHEKVFGTPLPAKEVLPPSVAAMIAEAKNLGAAVKEADDDDSEDHVAVRRSLAEAAVTLPVTAVSEVKQDLFRHELVRCLLNTSLTKPPTQKEMVSKVLSDLYGNCLEPDDIQLGVIRLLATLEDLSLDNPQASELMSRYIVRMVVDDILPPAFVSDFLRLSLGGSLGLQTLRRGFKWLTETGRHHLLAERFQKVWTGTEFYRPEVGEFNKNLKEAILYYFANRDIQATIQAFNEMDMSPDQEVAAVRKLIVMALDHNEQTWYDTLKLLQALSDSKEIDGEESIVKGFQEVVHRIDDLKLDIPNVEKIIKEYFIPAAKQNALLPQDFDLGI